MTRKCHVRFGGGTVEKCRQGNSPLSYPTTDPTVHLPNRAALEAGIGQFLTDYPGAALELVGDPAYHHHYIRFEWVIIFADGGELPGIDFGEISPDGKLAKIVGFF